MLINSATDKVFRDDTNDGVSEHAHEEELLETAYEAQSSLPNIFSFAASAPKNTNEKSGESLEEVAALCRAQSSKPLPERYPSIAYAVKLGRYDVVKFLIDQGESVNEATPDIPVNSSRVGPQHGYSPLELAIKQQDVEMVKLLTAYGAVPEISYNRFSDLTFYASWNCYFGRYLVPAKGSPLSDAVKTGNQEIVDLVIKAYSDPSRLFSDFGLVQGFKQTSAMQAWIEQYHFLVNGEQKEVAEEVVELFMNKKGLNASLSNVEKMLQCGWKVTQQEFESALIANDPQMLKLLLDHPHMEENPFFALARHNRVDLIAYLFENGKMATSEHLETAIRHGAVDAVKAFIERGVSLNGTLELAVDQKQWPTARYLASLSKNIYELVELCRAQSSKPLIDNYPPIAFAVLLGRHDVVQFFIDHGESVNAATPDVPVRTTYDCDSETKTCSSHIGWHQGATPLEIAVGLQDEAMVKLLLANGANPDVHYSRFNVYPFNGDTHSGYWKRNDVYEANDRGTNSHILLDALKRENQGIIDLVIKAYSDPEKLYAEYAAIQAAQKPEAMRSWIEQNIFLWKGEYNQVSDAAVTLFMEHRLESSHTAREVEMLLQHGWIVTKQEFEQALIANDPQSIQLLVANLIERGNVLGREYLGIAIKQGVLDAVKVFIDNGLTFDGVLVLATEQKQKAIVEYLLTLPIGAEEIAAARLAAYRVHAYDIMELLELIK